MLREPLVSVGLLVLRLVAGGAMLYGNGWAKLVNFGSMRESFPDPIGVGATASLSLAVFAEVFCSLGLITGLLTRLASLPLAITMAVAIVMIHGGDGWDKWELPLLYFGAYVTLMFTGPGKYSLDSVVSGRKRR